MSADTVVTRFAPSPTGALHIGGARTALFSWVFARQQGGRFILRIEDTDQARSDSDAIGGILEGLKWLGLEWDEGPEAGGADQQGDRGPYIQSQRLSIYAEHTERLLKTGHAYVPEDEPEIVRFRMGKTVIFEDAVYGPIEVEGPELNDFVIRKSDGFPTFHLAVVVDDALMGVTHVIRGQEHLSNTPRHVALQDALGLDRPVYAHVPSILNPNGSKMSKRDKAKAARAEAKRWLDSRDDAKGALAAMAGIHHDALMAFLEKETDDLDIATALATPAALDITLPDIDVADFRRSGFLPEAICNYIALLGWNPGNNIERFELDFLIENFGLDRIGKANAKFDRDKLLAFNADTITALPANEWRDRLRQHLIEYRGTFSRLTGSERHFATFADTYQPRSRTLDEPADLGEFFVRNDETIEYDQKAMKKVLQRNDGEGITVLGKVMRALQACEEWSSDSLDAVMKHIAAEQGVGMGKIAQPLRVAVSGGTVSPPIHDTLAILGKRATLTRIEICLNSLGN